MPDMQKQVDAIREAFSADVRKPFVLKPSFPYSSPRSGSRPSPQGLHAGFGTAVSHPGGSMDQHLTPTGQHHPQVAYAGHPVSPPISAGPVDSKGDARAVQAMMAQGTQASSMQQTISLSEPPTWNPARIFE